MASAINLALTVVRSLQDRTGGSALLVSGIVTLGMGILMLALGKRTPTSQC